MAAKYRATGIVPNPRQLVDVSESIKFVSQAIVCDHSSLSLFFLCDSVIFLFVCCYVYILVIVCKKKHQGERFYGVFSHSYQNVDTSNRTVGSRSNKKVQ